MIKVIGNAKRIGEKQSHARIQEFLRETASNRQAKSNSKAFTGTDRSDLCPGFFCLAFRSTQFHLCGVVRSTDGNHRPDDG